MARLQQNQFEMQVLQEGHCHMKPGALGADWFARLGLVTGDECPAGDLGRVEASCFGKSECGSLHEEPSDIRFGFACAELIHIDSCDTLCSFDQDTHWMKIAVTGHDAGRVTGQCL